MVKLRKKAKNFDCPAVKDSQQCQLSLLSQQSTLTYLRWGGVFSVLSSSDVDHGGCDGDGDDGSGDDNGVGGGGGIVYV